MIKSNRRGLFRQASLTLLVAGIFQKVIAQRTGPKAEDCNCTRAADGTPLDAMGSEIRPVIERYEVELRNFRRVYGIPGSSARRAKLGAFFEDQLRQLDAINFDALSQPGKVDYLLLRNLLQAQEKQLSREAREDDEIAALVPFQPIIVGLEEARRRMETVVGQKSAADLVKIVADVESSKASMAGSKADSTVLNRAAIRTSQLRLTLRGWFGFYDL
jgi:hypothetical protein